jgi:hypothetical protein
MLVIHCADIGSINGGKFGWARLEAERNNPCKTGTDIREFTSHIASDLNAGHQVAVGFECPLYVPLPEDPMALTSGRPGEGNRPWSAGAGCGSLATGLTETLWILACVFQRTTQPIAAFLDWSPFVKSGAGLFVWEAFVTRDKKAGTHHGDAEVAVRAFQEALPDPERHNAIVPQGKVRSLIGAALLQAGWSTDVTWLSKPCLVIRG